MFQKFNKSGNFDIIIGETSAIRGDLESDGAVRIDGKLEGSVTSKGEVIISEKASVVGNVYAQLAEIFGKCKGNVVVQSNVTLHTGGMLQGDVSAESFHAEKGAEYTGHCTILPRLSENTNGKIEKNTRRPETKADPAKSSAPKQEAPKQEHPKQEASRQETSKLEPVKRDFTRSDVKIASRTGDDRTAKAVRIPLPAEDDTKLRV